MARGRTTGRRCTQSITIRRSSGAVASRFTCSVNARLSLLTTNATARSRHPAARRLCGSIAPFESSTLSLPSTCTWSRCTCAHSSTYCSLRLRWAPRLRHRRHCPSRRRSSSGDCGSGARPRRTTLSVRNSSMALQLCTPPHCAPLSPYIGTHRDAALTVAPAPFS